MHMEEFIFGRRVTCSSCVNLGSFWVLQFLPTFLSKHTGLTTLYCVSFHSIQASFPPQGLCSMESLRIHCDQDKVSPTMIPMTINKVNKTCVNWFFFKIINKISQIIINNYINWCSSTSEGKMRPMVTNTSENSEPKLNLFQNLHQCFQHRGIWFHLILLFFHLFLGGFNQ